MLFSFHLRNLILVVFGNKDTKMLRDSLFIFYFSFRLACLALHRTENHATKVTKKQKTKLPKYVMSRALEGEMKEFLSFLKSPHLNLVYFFVKKRREF